MFLFVLEQEVVVGTGREPYRGIAWKGSRPLHLETTTNDYPFVCGRRPRCDLHVLYGELSGLERYWQGHQPAVKQVTIPIERTGGGFELSEALQDSIDRNFALESSQGGTDAKV